MPSEPPPRSRTRVNAKLTQATLDGGLIAPPKITLLRITMKPYVVGTKKEEVAALQLLLPKDVSNLYQGPFGSALKLQAPGGIFNEALHDNLIPLLYNNAMNDLDTYVTIDKLLKTIFRATAVNINVLHCRKDDIGRYMCAPQLAHLLDTTLKAQQRNNNSESAEESKTAAVEDEDLDKAMIVAVEGLTKTMEQFERLLTNMTPMASAQASYVDWYNLNEPTTQTPPNLSLINVLTTLTQPQPTTPKYEAPPYIYLVPSTTAEEELTSPASNNNAPHGTLRSNTESIDYDQINNNPYDPNAPHSDSDETTTVIADTANLHQDNFEEEIANNHNDIENDLEDYFQNQDLLQAQEGEVSSLNAEAEAEYEDAEQYLHEGQEYKEERRQSLKRLALERREPDGNLRQP